MANNRLSTKSINPSFRYLALTSAILVYLVIVMGGIVRASGASAICSTWPACNGQWLPPLQIGAIIDYIHRLFTALLGPVLLLTGYFAWRDYHRDARISRPVAFALGLLLLQVLLGAAVVFENSLGRQPVAALHLGLSLLIQGAVLVAAVAAFYQARLGDPPASCSFRSLFTARSPFARLSRWTLAFTFVLLVTGGVVSGSAADQACPGWPLCGGAFLPAHVGGWINLVHRLAVGVSGILVAWLFIKAWRTQRTQTPILVAASAAAVLFFAQALMGAYDVANGFPMFMLSLHEATAAAVWSALVVLVVAVGMANRAREDEIQEELQARGRKGLVKDFLALTKPIVVLLLLVTTFAGMVIGLRAWPSFSLVFWTLLGGAMAAGGSGAINQYIDRYDDTKMQRTERRPIPSGRMTPGEGLAFGVILTLASFYVMVAFVNLLAALLSLAGILYYVLLYSIFLKKATVQNIVIGGGAGAIPPLVGWAAATGSLNIPSLFLFAVVFMWTPPHFWALAIVRRNDYARAGVPMLPVVRGEQAARWQILVYSLELVGLTLLLPLVGLGGSIYLVSAAVLGLALLLYAYRLWKTPGNKVAWMMYRYSSMYLAFLFVALMVDRLVGR